MTEIYSSDKKLEIGSIEIAPILWDCDHKPHFNVKLQILKEVSKEDYINDRLAKGKSLDQIMNTISYMKIVAYYLISMD